MTDYLEEQSTEIEALESIYPDELQIVSTEPYHCFRMVTTSQCDSGVEDVTCVMQFTYTAKYPDEAPVMEILSCEELTEDDTETLLNVMKEQVEENLGMGMIFTLVSAAQEKLTEIVEQAARAVEDEKEAAIRAIEEAERKRLEGTRVTVESFMVWRTGFDEERLALKKAKGLDKAAINSTKPTGKDLFMQDHTLDDSDVKFLEEEGGTAVAVDESLFEDLEDLDLDDDMDDPDFDPNEES